MWDWTDTLVAFLSRLRPHPSPAVAEPGSSALSLPLPPLFSLSLCFSVFTLATQHKLPVPRLPPFSFVAPRLFPRLLFETRMTSMGSFSGQYTEKQMLDSRSGHLGESTNPVSYQPHRCRPLHSPSLEQEDSTNSVLMITDLSCALNKATSGNI